jgi:Fe-S oxidoreductase
MAMRDLLRRMGKKRFNPGTAAAMFFLNATNPQKIRLARKLMIDWGYRAARREPGVQRLRTQTDAHPPSTTGKAPLREQVIHFVNKKMPGGLPKRTARALLDIENADYVPIIRNPALTSSDTEAVFYFPGCGSERLFSQVGLATQAMLWHVGVQTVLPPGYLCCGYPQRGAGQFDKAEKIMTDNRVLFHRVANTLNYLDIRTVVVSCGTCYDQLQGYKFEEIFPGCRIIDIHEYLMEKNVRLEGVTGYALHVPRPVPLADEDLRSAQGRQHAHERCAERTASRKNDRCCGESGTLALTRPGRLDPGALPQGRGIARRRERLRAAEAARSQIKVLTSCPSCLQGLKRLQRGCEPRRRLHRGRDRAPFAGRELDGRVCRARQCRRHRTRAGLDRAGSPDHLRPTETHCQYGLAIGGDGLIVVGSAPDGFAPDVVPPLNTVLGQPRGRRTRANCRLAAVRARTVESEAVGMPVRASRSEKTRLILPRRSAHWHWPSRSAAAMSGRRCSSCEGMPGGPPARWWLSVPDLDRQRLRDPGPSVRRSRARTWRASASHVGIRRLGAGELRSPPHTRPRAW